MLRDELTNFASAIRGDEELPSGMAACPHYLPACALGIYRNNYRGNLHDALAAAYPVTVQIVGTDFFRHLAHKFIGQYPSRSGNLHEYGAELPGFLCTFAAAQSLVYLPDVAALEWACHLAYYAPDACPFDLTRLQQIPVEHYASLTWLFHPASHILYSAYPLAHIWHSHQPDASEDFHIDLASGGGTVLVNRHNDTVEVGALSADEGAWLQRIQTGATLGAATDATVAAYPSFDLSSTLSRFVTQGVLIDFVLPPGAIP